MTAIHELTEHDIARDVANTIAYFGELYGRAAETAIPVGSIIFGLNDKPCTVTRVLGCRFVWVTCAEHPDEHLIDVRYFKTSWGASLVDVIEAQAQPGEGR